MSWIRGPLLGFDTETTGVDVEHDRIVTAALVRRDATGTRVRTWLVAPGVEIPAEATAVHGIRTEDAERHGRAPADALEEIASELTQALRDGVPVVAYNASFDLCLLETELRRHGLPTLHDRLDGDRASFVDPLVLDRDEDPGREGPRRLADLCGAYRVAAGRLHTADADALATLDLLAALVVRFPHLGATDLPTLHRSQVTAQRSWDEGRDARRESRDLTGPSSDSSTGAMAGRRTGATADPIRPVASFAGTG